MSSKSSKVRRVPVTESILDQIEPEDALDRLKQGNKKFQDLVKNKKKPLKRNLNDFVENGAGGQYPFAIVLSCVDSRIPTEIIFDQHIGDIFNARIAGNFVNEDILGSMEFACGRPSFQLDGKNYGVKVIVVLGHTSCGAVKAACNAVYPMPDNRTKKEKEKDVGIPPNLAQLVGKLMPAVAATPVDDMSRLKNAPSDSEIRRNFVNKAAETNVRQTIGDILVQSDFLREKALRKEILIRGAIYHVEDGKVRFL